MTEPCWKCLASAGCPGRARCSEPPQRRNYSEESALLEKCSFLEDKFKHATEKLHIRLLSAVQVLGWIFFFAGSFHKNSNLCEQLSQTRHLPFIYTNKKVSQKILMLPALKFRDSWFLAKVT